MCLRERICAASSAKCSASSRARRPNRVIRSVATAATSPLRGSKNGSRIEKPLSCRAQRLSRRVVAQTNKRCGTESSASSAGTGLSHRFASRRRPSSAKRWRRADKPRAGACRRGANRALGVTSRSATSRIMRPRRRRANGHRCGGEAGRQGLGGKNLAALTTEGISLVVADPAIFCDRRKKMAPRLSPAGPKVGLDEACAPDRGCRVGSLRCRADKPNASPRSRPRPVPLARKFDCGVQGVSEVASAHSRPEQRVNNVNFVIEVDGVGYFGGDDPHSARSRSPAAARVARSRRATIREAEKIAHDRLHDFRIRFALERLSRVAVFELGPRASWPSWRTNRSRSASTVSSAVSVLSSAAVTPVSS